MLGDQLLEAQACANFGIVLRRQGQPNKAIRRYLAGLRLYEELEMPYEMAQIQNNLAGTYLQLGKFEKARTFYERALQSLEGLGENDLRAQILKQVELVDGD